MPDVIPPGSRLVDLLSLRFDFRTADVRKPSGDVLECEAPNAGATADWRLSTVSSTVRAHLHELLSAAFAMCTFRVPAPDESAWAVVVS